MLFWLGHESHIVLKINDDWSVGIFNFVCASSIWGSVLILTTRDSVLALSVAGSSDFLHILHTDNCCRADIADVVGHFVSGICLHIKFAMVNFIRRFWQQGEVMHNRLQFHWKRWRKPYLLPEWNLIGTQKSVTSGVLLIHCSLDTNDPVSCASYRVSADKNDPATRKICWESGTYRGTLKVDSPEWLTRWFLTVLPILLFTYYPVGGNLVPLLPVFKETYALRDWAGCL